MSQRDLARKLGVSSATIGMYESGKRTPSLKKAILIARLFDVQVEDITFSTQSYIDELSALYPAVDVMQI